MEGVSGVEAYITKNQAIHAMEQVTQPECFIEDTRKNFVKIIEELPAADVAPVVHGQWERMRRCSDAYGTTEATCQACKTQQRLGDYSDYCPKCGARMRKD